MQYYIMKIMQNKHIEHPEDSILTGDLTVLDWFGSGGNISAKIDGAPAIVWGRNPATGNFFVGTKSVFNKVKIKINESHEDIDKNHEGNVADILHFCFDYLPETDNIYQGDFIGFGGDDQYTPNTITYYFDEEVTSNIIIAPHTYYIAEGDLRNAVAHPLKYFTYESNNDVRWIRPKVTISEHLDDIIDHCKFARQMSTLVEFVNDKQAANIKKQLNAHIRELSDIEDDGFDCDPNLIRLWKLVESIKLDMFAFIERDDDITCYIDEEECDHEGYVLANEFGTFKIVHREIFSHHNFAGSRFRN